MPTTNHYAGPERRIRRVFVTRNTEYHFERGCCVGVKDRESGRWLLSHLAIGQQIGATLRAEQDGTWRTDPGEPLPGQALLFTGAHPLATSVLREVQRPSRHDVALYGRLTELAGRTCGEGAICAEDARSDVR